MPQEEPKRKNQISPISMIGIIVFSVFLAETSLMFILDDLPPLPPVFHALLDSTLLTLTIAPMLYFFIYRPLRQRSELKHLVDTLNAVISHRQIAEEELKQTKEQYRFLIDNINMGIALIDVNYKVVTANRFHGNMFQKPEGTFVGKYCFMEFEKREDVCPHCPGRKAMISGNIEEAETEGVLDDGARVSVHIKAFPIIGTSGQITGFIEVVEDITQRKKSETNQHNLIEKLKHSQESLESANANLKAKMEELEKFQRAIMGREDRILQLKKRLKELEGEKAAG